MISKPQIYFAYHHRHKYFPNSSNVFISHKFLPSITQTKCRKKVEELKAHTTNWNNIYRLYSAAPSSVFLLPRFNKDISTLSFRKIVYGVRCFDSSQCRVENILMVYISEYIQQNCWVAAKSWSLSDSVLFAALAAEKLNCRNCFVNTSEVLQHNQINQIYVELRYKGYRGNYPAENSKILESRIVVIHISKLLAKVCGICGNSCIWQILLEILCDSSIKGKKTSCQFRSSDCWGLYIILVLTLQPAT